MTPAVWMVAGSAGSCVLALGVFGGAVAIELLAGLFAPLVATVGTWVAVVRTHRQDPGAVHALMITGFGLKVIFFCGYVVVALGVMDLNPTPFIASFTAYFVSLYLAEALLLARLFSGRLHLAR